MGITRQETILQGEDMPRLRFVCEVVDGEITIHSFDAPNGTYYLELKKTETRSPKQNNYYWFVVEILAEDLGYTQQEMHTTLKNHFDITSTKHLSKKEFADFLERIIRWAAIDFGIALPDPHTSRLIPL